MRRGDFAVLEMHWLIAERDRGVRHVADLHELWLCPREVLVDAFTAAGFDTPSIDASPCASKALEKTSRPSGS